LDAWTKNYPDGSPRVEQPGIALLAARPGFLEWMWLNEDPGSSGGLTEVRWQPPAADVWEWTLYVDATGDFASNPGALTAGRRCTVTRGTAPSLQLEADVFVGGHMVSDDKVSGPDLQGPVVLQSWVQGGMHHCRIVPEDGTERPEVAVSLPGALPGTIILSVMAPAQPPDMLDIPLDWVRVFAPPPE
jgi:hypothetical protein